MKTKLVFTTDPEEAKRLRESNAMPLVRDAAPAAQNIRVMLDRKRRGGKTAGQLKKRCGAGGTAKDREIEIQGDHAEAVIAELTKLGYRVKRAGA